jgi:chemotaxis response regulator CheB
VSTSFPLVSIGGSAGGLDAFCEVLDNLPVNTGCAFVIVNHARSGFSLLPEILRRHTRMPVIEIRDGMEIECNQVFVIPPACDLRVRDGKFVLEPPSKVYGWPNVISLFLSSVVANWKGRCVAILVSGLHSDGVAALRAVRAGGGWLLFRTPQPPA